MSRGKLKPEELADIRERDERELKIAQDFGYTPPAFAHRHQLLGHITALEAEKAELHHTSTCQTITIDAQHCDCHRRALCDCPECIQSRNKRLKQEQYP